MPGEDERRSRAVAVVGRYRGRGVPEEASGFARRAVSAAGPGDAVRARSLLWAASRLAAWGLSVGLQPTAEVLLHPSTIERYVAVGMSGRGLATRRTTRTNLRQLSRRAGLRAPAEPAPLARGRAKAPYSPAEVDAFFGLARTQPSEARRQRMTGLLCLGLGAGLQGSDLRHVTGRHVLARSGGVVVVVEGRRSRVVPVLARYREALLAAADFAGEGFVVGGASHQRKNLTWNLVGRLAGGDHLPVLEVSRLRASWLSEHLERLGLPAFLAAAGVRQSQRVFDLALGLAPPAEASLVALLG